MWTKPRKIETQTKRREKKELIQKAKEREKRKEKEERLMEEGDVY